MGSVKCVETFTGGLIPSRLINWLWLELCGIDLYSVS